MVILELQEEQESININQVNNALNEIIGLKEEHLNPYQHPTNKSIIKQQRQEINKNKIIIQRQQRLIEIKKNNMEKDLRRRQRALSHRSTNAGGSVKIQKQKQPQPQPQPQPKTQSQPQPQPQPQLHHQPHHTHTHTHTHHTNH